MKTQIRILFLSVIALVVTLGVAPQTCTATPTVVTGDSSDFLKVTVTGGPIDADFTLELSLGTDWQVFAKIVEDAGTTSDALTISGEAFHRTGPHGEAPNGANRFMFSFPVNAADFAAGSHTLPGQFLTVGHGQHFDQFIGLLSFTVTQNFLGFRDITHYNFQLIGQHTLTNQPIPEPTTMLLLGTGLAGVAIKTRKRLKNRKGG